MRYPKEHKQQTAGRIVRTAGRLFRRHGYAATGVDKVMAAAGLTAGGFYLHFRSKQDLLAATLDKLFLEANNDRPTELSNLRGHEWLRTFVSFYLSRTHRDTPAHGCPIAALANEVSRVGGKPRTVFRRHIERVIGSIACQFDSEVPDRQRAVSAISQCLGALVLARALGRCELSGEILESCRESVMQAIAQSETLYSNTPSGN